MGRWREHLYSTGRKEIHQNLMPVGRVGVVLPVLDVLWEACPLLP